MAIIKDVYDAKPGNSRSNTYRFTVDNLDDPLYGQLKALIKKQNKNWRDMCIQSRSINQYVYPQKVTNMPRGPRVASVIEKYGKSFVEENPFRRRIFDQNLPKEFATSFDIYVSKDTSQFQKMKSWIDSNIKCRKNWLKIKKLEQAIFDIEYIDNIVGAGFKV